MFQLSLEEDTGGQGAILYGDLKPGQRAEEARKSQKNLSLQRHLHPIIHDVPCVPLHSVLLALNRTSVDYLSLDVEGLELPILQSFPHQDIHISAMTVEYNHAEGDSMDMRNAISSMGYTYVKNIDVSNSTLNIWSHDFVFVK